MPREEAMRIPDLIRTKVNLIPETITQIRTVNIEGLDLQADSSSSSLTTQHMVIIKFKLGITRIQLVEEIRSEANVANVFSELIRDSFIAETDGHIALIMIVEGDSDSDVADSVQGKIIPSLQKNHGEESIDELRTIRLLGTIRREHNYLPMVNMEEAVLREDWPDEAIFVG